MIDFVNLHAHSNIGSFLDAMISVDELFDRVKELGQKAVAITDHGTMAGHVDGYKAYKRTGIKFIPGCENYFVHTYDYIDNPTKGRRKTEKRKHLVLLAKNQTGYRNLLRANFMGYQNSVSVMGRIFPRISWDVIEKHNEGIICTSACSNGPVSVLITNGQIVEAEEMALRFLNIFKDGFYIELQPHLLKIDNLDQHNINKNLINIAHKYGIPLTCATDTHYVTESSEKYHDVLMALNSKTTISDPNRHRYGIKEFYVKSGEEVYNFLKKHYGVDVANEAIENTVKIADMCDNPDYIMSGESHLPVFNPKDECDYEEFKQWCAEKNITSAKEDVAFMRFRVFKSFMKKFGHLPREVVAEKFARVKKEFAVLEKNNFSSYLLVVSDFINWAKRNDILVGIGRGCLSGDTLVLTDNGYKRLDLIKVGDFVYSHNGNLREVLKAFEYKIDEELLTITTDFSYNNISLTSDHLVYGSKNMKDIEWIPAQNLNVGDYIYVPFLKDFCVENNLERTKLLILSFLEQYGSIQDEVEYITLNTEREALSLRDDLLQLKIPSNIRIVSGLFEVSFSGLRTPFGKELCSRMDDNGYFVKVKDINATNKYNFVYDINVDAEFSYLTQNFVVHNSVGGSMVAYLLGIHGVDPTDYNLLFERFQNAEKKDFPDIDTDFTSAGKDRVQQYCIEKYGADKCAFVSNINKYTPKNVIPDLVKSMREEDMAKNLIQPGENYVKVSDAIKEVIPEVDEDGEKITSLEDAIRLSPKLKEFSRKCPELMEYADKIIGLPKEWSTHAAGMVISDRPILDFAPLRVDKNGAIAVQLEKNRCENVGLVKMDFLAISTLDIIDETFKNMKKLGITDGPTQMEDIPLDDADTYRMIQDGHTRCVFQLGKSPAVINLCKSIKPKNIDDIAAINALCRPACGPRQMEDGKIYDERKEYISRRFGGKKVEYLHPSLENSLSKTYGLCIIEEQLMSVAKDVAGWDLNKADGLRKLTKLKGKDPKLVLKLEIEFIEGMMNKHGVSYEFAGHIWREIVLKFSGYGFNYSHATFYSINGYITAYLKRHYSSSFFAAYLKIKTQSNGVNRDDEIAIAKTECRKFGVKIIPPDINQSGSGYEVLDENTIVMGLKAVKGLGEKAVEEIINTQPFENFTDFIYRTNGRVINKGRIEALAKAGCFDSFNVTRKDVFECGKLVRDRINASVKKTGSFDDNDKDRFDLKFSGEEWSKREILNYEREVLDELVSGSLDDLFPNFFTGRMVTPLNKLKILPDRHEINVEVVVQSKIKEFKIKKEGRYFGKTMMKYRVADVSNTETELTIWPDSCDEFRDLVGDGGIPIRAICQISNYNGENTLMLRELNKVYGKK